MNWWKSGHTELFFLEGAKTQDIDSNWELIYLSYFHCPGQHYTARIYKKNQIHHPETLGNITLD